MGSVMADSRKDPMVKARFSLSSWSLQIGQPFISRCSSGSSIVDTLELFSATKKKECVNLGLEAKTNITAVNHFPLFDIVLQNVRSAPLLLNTYQAVSCDSFLTSCDLHMQGFPFHVC